MKFAMMNRDKINKAPVTRAKPVGMDFFEQLLAMFRSTRMGHVLSPVLWLVPCMLVTSTVFVVSNELANGVISGKYFWFYGSMGLVCVTTLIRIMVNKCSFRFSAMDWLVLLFVITVYVSAFFFNDASRNITKLTILTLLLVLYFSVRVVAITFRREGIVQDLLCLFIIFTGLIEAVWGLLQLYGFERSQHNLFKLTGSFFNLGPYAGYLSMIFPMALQYWIHGTSREIREKQQNMEKAPTLFSRLPRVFACIACIAILLVLPPAMSRASWLAAIAGSAVVLYSRYHERVKKFYLQYKRQARITGCVMILFLSAALTGMYYLKKDSADGRTLTWKISLQTVVKHPFGVGLGNFPGAYGETQAAYFASGQATETEKLVAGNPEYGFNEYLQIAVESGILAFLLFAGILFLSIRDGIKTKRWGVLGSLVALLVFASFSYPFSILPFLIVLVFLLAINPGRWNVNEINSCGLSNDYSRQEKNHVNISNSCSIALALSCLLVTAFCLWKQYPVYHAYKQWRVTRVHYHAGLFQETAESHGSLYPYLDDQVQFLFEYAQCLSKSDQPGESNTVLQRAMQISCDPMLYNIMGKNYQAMKDYERAEIALVKATQVVPSRLYPWYLLAKLYAEMGSKEKMIETVDIVLTKEPKVHSPAVEEMREEMNKLKIKE
jgi:hypothetical protein